MSNSIRLSEKHGVNPALGVCCLCGQEDGSVILLGRLEGDAEAPRHICASQEPCDTCKDMMRQGVLLIEVPDDGPTGPAGEMRRTGALWVVTEEAARRIFPTIGDKRAAFVSKSAAEKVGLHE